MRPELAMVQPSAVRVKPICSVPIGVLRAKMVKPAAAGTCDAAGAGGACVAAASATLATAADDARKKRTAADARLEW